MGFKAPVEEYKFFFTHIFKLESLLHSGGFGDSDLDDIEMFLEAIAKISEETIAPLQRSGDMNPAILENGVVTTPPGFQEGYEILTQSGLVGTSASINYGGLGLPKLVQNALNEFVNGACLSLALNPLLTQGQIEALELFATEEIKEQVIPKLLSGECYGTMNITEPQAGSDVGAIKTKATPLATGEYKISGQKIFISWADADFAKNVYHLVLARLPDSPKGTSGLSLFLVPKYLAAGESGHRRRNNLQILSLEKKLGLHGSPTGVVSFDQALGQIIGHPNEGLKAMFAMMNSARLGVGTQGVGVAEAALQTAEYYAKERKQGIDKSDGQPQVIRDYPDIKRLLSLMRVKIFTARAICSYCAFSLDMAKITGEEKWQNRAGLLTPIAKYIGSETGVEVSLAAIRIHGGAGYIEESGVSQYLRDSIVTTIYEGTNGIQANDLLLRKLGTHGKNVLELIEDIIEKTAFWKSQEPNCYQQLILACNRLKEITKWLVNQQSESPRLAVAQAYLQAIGLLLGAYFLVLSTNQTERKDYIRGLTTVFFNRIFPQIHTLSDEVLVGDTDLQKVNFE